jgi:hypothetical protein
MVLSQLGVALFMTALYWIFHATVLDPYRRNKKRITDPEPWVAL